MPDRFGQAELFEDLDPTKSPLELFEDALEDALEGKADSDAFDHTLLETCANFRTVLGAGVESIEIKNGRLVRVDVESLQQVVRLSRQSFAPRKVRLAGRLDIIRYSDCRFTLVLEDGAKVAGTARELGAEALRAGFGKDVVVSGTADFRPSGRMLRIDAEGVEPATASELKIFSALPRPLQAAALAERPAKKGGLEALLGKWPGDESAEQLLEQLAQLS